MYLSWVLNVGGYQYGGEATLSDADGGRVVCIIRWKRRLERVVHIPQPERSLSSGGLIIAISQATSNMPRCPRNGQRTNWPWIASPSTGFGILFALAFDDDSGFREVGRWLIFLLFCLRLSIVRLLPSYGIQRKTFGSSFNDVDVEWICIDGNVSRDGPTRCRACDEPHLASLRLVLRPPQIQHIPWTGRIQVLCLISRTSTRIVESQS